MTSVIGYPLDKAKELLKNAGILSATVILTQAPRERDASDDRPCEYRVVRQKLASAGAELTVVKRCLFPWDRHPAG